MNQQTSATKKEQLVQRVNVSNQGLHIETNEELVYQQGQILSGKNIDSKQNTFNFHQRDYYNEQLVQKKGQNNETIQNLTSPDYNQQTLALESSSNLNVHNLETQMSASAKPNYEQTSIKNVNKQIITSDMRSRLKNKNNIKINQQQQQQQQKTLVGGVISPIAIAIRSKSNNQGSPQSINRKNQEDSDQYFENTRRITSSKEIDNGWKSPLGLQSTRGFNQLEENLSTSQHLKKQRRVNSKDEQQLIYGKRQDYPLINGGVSSSNLIEDNPRGGPFKRRENKNDTNISGGSRVLPEKMKALNNKQMSAFSQQSILTKNEEDQKNLTLQVPGIRFSPQTNQGQTSPNQKGSQSSQIKSQPLITQKESPQKLAKIPQSQSSKGFFSFFSRFINTKNNSNQNTPQSSSGTNTLHNIPLNLQQSHSNNQSNANLNNASNPAGNLISQQQQNNVNGSIANLPPVVSEINPGTNWNFVKKLAKVKKFIDSIKTSNLYQSFYKVKKSHLEMINDKSDYHVVIDSQHQKLNTSMHLSEAQQQQLKKNQKYTLFSAIINSIESLSQYIPLYLPHQPMLNWFKVAMLIITIITLVYVPLKGSFSLVVSMGSPEFYCIFLVPFLLFILEIFVTFNTAYYEEGDIQMNRMKIIRQYIRSTFLIDLISTISCYFLYVEQKLFCVFFVMVRLLKMGAYRREINEYFYIQQRSYTTYTLVNLIFTVIFVAHYFACGFNYIAVIEEDVYDSRSWVITLNIEQHNWLSRYINSIYFSFITMVTVGFGDIKPTTDPEKVYVTLVALISSLIFAYTVNTIGTVFQEIAQQEAEYKSQKYHLSVYMRSRAINQQLQTRVMKYLDHMIHKQLESPEKGQEILKKMSKKIRDEIYKDFYGKILTNSKMFKFNFSETFLKDLTVQMKEIICRPGEIIFSLNEVDNRIFFINKGEVQLFLEKYKKKDDQDNYTYDILTKGDIFGEQSFFTTKLRETSAKSLSVSHLIYCTYEDFVQVLKQFPKDYEKFCQMKDEVLNYGEQLNTRCTVCQKFRHSIVDCPYVHLTARRENVIHRHIRSIPNERAKPEQDRRKKKINTLEQNQKVRIKLRKLRKMYVSNTNKKLKDDSNNVLLDDNKAGYFINVKKTQDTDDSIDSIISEKYDELRKLSDKKFFLQTPKLYRDQQMQICIQNEDDEYIEELEDDEFQNDSQEIQIQDEDEDNDDEDEDDDDDDDDEDEDEEDELLEDDDDDDEDVDDENEDGSAYDEEYLDHPNDDLIEGQVLNQNDQSVTDLGENIPTLVVKDSIFKTLDLERKKSEQLNKQNLEKVHNISRNNSILDDDATQQQMKSKNADNLDDFNFKDFKRMSTKKSSMKQQAAKNDQQQSSSSDFERKPSKTVPNAPSVTFTNDKENQLHIPIEEIDNPNIPIKTKNLNLNVYPSSPNSTATKSNQTINNQRGKEGDSRGEQETNQNGQAIQRHRFSVDQRQNKKNTEIDNNQQNLNFYSNATSNNHSKSTSIAEQVPYSNNKSNSEQKKQEQFQNAISEYEYEHDQDHKKRNQQPSIENYTNKSIEDTNQIRSLQHIPRQVNFQHSFSLNEKLSSLQEVASVFEKSKIQTEKTVCDKNHNFNQVFENENLSSQLIKSIEDNFDNEEENEGRYDPNSQVSIKSNMIEYNNRARSEGERSNKNQANNQNSGEENQSKSSSITKRAQQDSMSSQNTNVRSYKDQNKLTFKGSIFNLKIAGLSNKQPSSVISSDKKSQNTNNIQHNRKHSSQNSQLTLGSYEALEELNSSTHQINTGNALSSTSGGILKDKEQKPKKKESRSEKNTDVPHRRKSKKDSEKFDQIQAQQPQSSRDYSKQGKAVPEEKKQKKRMSHNHIKIDTVAIQQQYKQQLLNQGQNLQTMDQQISNLQNKVDQSIDSGKSSRSSSKNLRKNLEKQDSIKQKARSLTSNKVLEHPGILKSKKTINLAINTSDIISIPPQLQTPQSNKLQRKQTNKSETPRNSLLRQENDLEIIQSDRQQKQRKDKKARILTTIVSPTIDNSKQGMKALLQNNGNLLNPTSGSNLLMPISSGNLLLPTSGHLLRLPVDNQNISVQNEEKEKKIPLKRKGTKNENMNNNTDLLQIPIASNLQQSNGGNTATSNTNSFGISSNKNSLLSNSITNNSFSQNNPQQLQNQFLKPSNFKNQHDFSSAWIQVQQQQQGLSLQNQQSVQSQQSQLPTPGGIHLLQVPNLQHHSFSFQNAENQLNASPSQQQSQNPNNQQSTPVQQQVSPHNTFKKQISINQYHNNHQIFSLNNNTLNPPSISQLKTFNHSQSLKQGQLPQPQTSIQQIPAGQPSLQPHQQLQHSATIRTDSQANQQQSQQSIQQQQNQQQQSQQQMQFANYQNYQQMTSIPMNLQNMPMNMMMLPSNNNILFQTNTNILENNYVDDQYIRNQDYHNQKTLYIYDFDRMKEFTNYFPHNNYTLVCKEKKRVVNRKNFFANKKMGNSSRNIMQNKIQIAHPSPRGMFQTGLLGTSHNFNVSFRGAVNKQLNSTNMHLSDKHLSVSGNINNGSQSNIPGSNNVSIIKEIPNDGKLSVSSSLVEKGKNKLKRATESLITSKRNSFRTNSKRSLRGGSDNLAITAYNHQIPRNSSFFHLGNTETEIKNMTNSIEFKQNLGSDKLNQDSSQTYPKQQETPRIISIDASNPKKIDQLLLNQNSSDLQGVGSPKLGIQKQQSQEYRPDQQVLNQQQSNSIIIDHKSNDNKFKQQYA